MTEVRALIRNRIRAISAAFAMASLLLLPLGAGHAADIKEHTLKFAFQNSKEHPQGMGAQKFADLVSQKSGGKITVKLFPSGQLGGDLQTVSIVF